MITFQMGGWSAHVPAAACERKQQMTGNLNARGFALAAALALCAMAAPVASADTFRSENVLTTLTGNQDGETNDVFTTTAGSITCEEASYTGVAVGTSVTSLTVTPVYGGCSLGGAVNTVVDENNCDYKLTLDTPPATTGTVHIECPNGWENIEFTVNSPGTIKCKIVLVKQTRGVLTYTNIGGSTTREITVDINAGFLTYQEEAGTGLGACKNGGGNNATLKGQALITGSSGGSHVGVFVQ
jgi:hypothetical protein